MIRTLVSASSELARAGLAAIVRGDARLALVGEAARGDLADRVATLGPDVVLEDRDVGDAPLEVPSVMLVDDARAAWLGNRLDRGANGARAILARDASTDEIVAAIVAVAAGLVAVQPRALAIAGETIEESDAIVAGSGANALTARERVVLTELSRGEPNKTIAARLGISEHTVKFHVASIFAKLAVSSRTEAVAQGVRLGFVML